MVSSIVARMVLLAFSASRTMVLNGNNIILSQMTNCALIEKYSFSPHLPFQKYFPSFFCFTCSTLDTRIFLLILDNAKVFCFRTFAHTFAPIFPLFESFIFSLDSGLCSHTTSLITLVEIPLSHCALTLLYFSSLYLSLSDINFYIICGSVCSSPPLENKVHENSLIYSASSTPRTVPVTM